MTIETQEYGASGAKLAMTFLGGLAVGYGIALLFAPRTGKETRAMLSDYAQTTGQRVSTLARDAAESAKNVAASAGRRVNDYIEEGKDKLKSAQNKASRAAGDAKVAVENEIERTKDKAARAAESYHHQ